MRPLSISQTEAPRSAIDFWFPEICDFAAPGAKRTAPADRRQHVAKENEGQLARHRAAARDLGIYLARMDDAMARRFDGWLKMLPRSLA